MDITKQIITYADTSEIDKFDNIAADVLRRVFKLEFSQTLITDESWLSDFSGCCVPDDEPIEDMSISEFNKIGNREMIAKFKELYNIDVEPHDRLVDVFVKIES